MNQHKKTTIFCLFVTLVFIFTSCNISPKTESDSIQNTGSNSDSNTGSDSGTNSDSNTGSNTGSDTGSGSGSNTGTGTGSGTGSNTGSNTGTNSFTMTPPSWLIGRWALADNSTGFLIQSNNIYFLTGNSQSAVPTPIGQTIDTANKIYKLHVTSTYDSIYTLTDLGTIGQRDSNDYIIFSSSDIPANSNPAKLYYKGSQ